MRRFLPAAVCLVLTVAACGHRETTHDAPPSAPAAGAAAGPANAPVLALGTPAGIPLDADQRAALDRAVAAAPAPTRRRLRYALALCDDGTRRLVVYDPGPQRGDGNTGSREFIAFLILNIPGRVHYDPRDNEVVEPLPGGAQH